MNHDDHVALLRPGLTESGGYWADLGSGTGAFTLALADLLGSTGRIISVDRDRAALRQQESSMRTRFPTAKVEYRAVDFSQSLELGPLDGVVMANALHFQRDPRAMVQRIRDWLRPGGRLILVEYDTDHGNTWVPYPLSYPTWEALAIEAGFAAVRLLETRPSRFLGRIYSAESRNPD